MLITVCLLKVIKYSSDEESV